MRSIKETQQKEEEEKEEEEEEEEEMEHEERTGLILIQDNERNCFLPSLVDRGFVRIDTLTYTVYSAQYRDYANL